MQNSKRGDPENVFIENKRWVIKICITNENPMFSSLFLRLYFAIEKMFFSFSLVILVGYSDSVSTYKSNSQRQTQNTTRDCRH